MRRADRLLVFLAARESKAINWNLSNFIDFPFFFTAEQTATNWPKPFTVTPVSCRVSVHAAVFDLIKLAFNRKKKIHVYFLTFLYAGKQLTTDSYVQVASVQKAKAL